MTPTGSEPLPRGRARWPIFHPDATATNRSTSARISTEPATWWNGSSTRSNNVAGSRHATTNWRPTTSLSSSLRRSGYGCEFMSPRLVRRQDRRVSLSGDSGGLDSVSPSFDVAPQQFCQVFGAPVLWRRHARSEVLHSLAHGRCVKCLGRCLVEAADNRLGRSLWEEKSVPAVDGHFCQALLPGGRKI